MKWLKSKPRNLQPGDTFEKYTVEKLLGRGGMGSVYLVRHTILDSLFALKVLFPEIAAKNSQFVDRFIREAKLACKIKHPNLISVHDAGQNPDNGMYYLVMDYVSGGDVRDLLKKYGRLPVRRAISIIEQVTSALETASQHHMVHRDIKPDNIMFAADGSVKLADLGIAKSTNEQDTTLTTETAVFGTPAYMSPEQAMDSRNVDPRADIYSLGIVLFEMLSGERPYHGESAIEILSQVVKDEDIPDIRTVCPYIPEPVAHLVADMTRKRLRERIPNPSALLARIHDLKLQQDKSALENSSVMQTVCLDNTMQTMVCPNSNVLSSTAVIHDAAAAAASRQDEKNSASPSEREPITPIPSSHAILLESQAERTMPMVPADAAPQNSSGKDEQNPAAKPEAEASTAKQVVPHKLDLPPAAAKQLHKRLIWTIAVLLSIIIMLCCIAPTLLHKRTSPEESSSASSKTEAASQTEQVSSSQTKEKGDSAAADSQADEVLETDELVNDAVIILSGTTETARNIKSSLKKSCTKPVLFIEAESLYQWQIKRIIRHKPHFVILMPSARWSKLGKSRANFETMLQEEVYLLKDNNIKFAFILDNEDPENPGIEGFNQAIRELCSLRSFDCYDSANWQSMLQLP